MTANGVIQILLFFGIVFALTKPLGSYMARVFQRERTFLDPVLVPVERLIYRLSGVKPDVEQHWTTYTIAMLLFNVTGLVLLYAMQRAPAPSAVESARPRTRSRSTRSFNTAVSFTTNTNWQSYVPEIDDELLHRRWPGSPFTTSSPRRPASRSRSRWCAASPATRSKTIGNFWVDLTRCTLWILLPICLAPRWCWSGRACRRT